MILEELSVSFRYLELPAVAATGILRVELN